MCHRWWFGDGGNHTHQFKPPYENSSSNQVVIDDHVQYIYAQPGKNKTFILFIYFDYIFYILYSCLLYFIFMFNIQNKF